MRFDAAIMPDWTGRVIVTDHLGTSVTVNGAYVDLTITQAPIYVRVVAVTGSHAQRGEPGGLFGLLRLLGTWLNGG